MNNKYDIDKNIIALARENSGISLLQIALKMLYWNKIGFAAAFIRLAIKHS